ncbi:hypothetical protein [Streptomyces sp. NPDC002685]|uniref:hypothetical protein n=1 Tax=Streptomyces sp. NPDC002685 TaxID=3154540 RepID=UPI00331F5211
MTHWLAAGGTFLLAVGSTAQAWFAVMEYRDLLDRTHTSDFARQMLAMVKNASNLLGVRIFFPAMIDMIRTELAMLREFSLIRQQGGENARRLAELSRTYVGWVTVLLGAVAVFASAVIELAVDYGDASYANWVPVILIGLALLIARVVGYVRWVKARLQ